MLNFDFSVKYLKLFNQLKNFNDDVLMRAIEDVFNDYLGDSIKRRLLRRVSPLRKTGKTEADIRAGKWILTRRANSLFARFVMAQNYLQFIDKGGTITSPKGWLLLPKDEHVKNGVVSSRIKSAVIPGTKLYKKTFIKYYKNGGVPAKRGGSADYGIIMERTGRNTVQGLWIVKKSVTIKPHHLFVDAVSAAERTMVDKMRERISEILEK